MVKLHKSIHKAFLLGFLILLLVMFILPFFSAQGYSMVRHTTSELGAQFTPNSWIMNIIFMGLGVLCILEALFTLRSFKMHQMILMLFGLGLILSGIFKHMPIDPDLSYRIREDDLHSVASSLVGMSFTFFAISSIFIVHSKRNKMIALSMGVLALTISSFIFILPDYAGVFQRLMFISSFVWLFYFLTGREFEVKTDGKDNNSK